VEAEVEAEEAVDATEWTEGRERDVSLGEEGR
jgi:hypothetical protein